MYNSVKVQAILSVAEPLTCLDTARIYHPCQKTIMPPYKSINVEE